MNRELRVVIFLLSMLCLMGLGVILHQAQAIVLPFALAVFISFMMNPIISFFEKRRVPNVIAILIVVLMTFVLFFLLGLLINNSIQSFTAEFPKYENRFYALLSRLFALLDLPPELSPQQGPDGYQFDWLNSLESISISGVITTTLSAIAKFLSNTILVLLFLMFILLGRNQINRKLNVAFEPEMSAKVVDIIGRIHLQIERYIVTKTLISLITAVLTTIVLFAFNVEFALIWGILTFLLNFIPSIGSAVATVLPVAVTFLQYESYLIIFSVIALLSAIQLVMGSFFDPRLVGRSVNLSPLVVLFSLIFWGWLWGIVGMFLAVPLSVIVKIILENIKSLRFVSILMSAKP